MSHHPQASAGSGAPLWQRGRDVLVCAPMIPRETILLQLAAYARRQPQDRAVWQRLQNLVGESPDPCSRSLFAPGHLTASACVLSPDGASVLLVHHAKLDRWLQPGGHVEPGDASLLGAAQREVFEECGVPPRSPIGGRVVPVDIDIHAIPARGADPEHLHFDVRYGFTADPTLPLVRSAESHAVRWIRLDDLQTCDVDASALRMIDRSLSELSSAS